MSDAVFVAAAAAAWMADGAPTDLPTGGGGTTAGGR